MRLLRFENEREFDRFKLFKSAIKEAVLEAFGVKPGESETSQDEPEISENDIL